MGRPSHYSLEIAVRCQRLIDELAPGLGANPRLVEQWGGPLRTTFLLAMSTPMLLLPLERIFKPFVLAQAGIADDSALDPAVSDRVRDALGAERPFAAAPFFAPQAWSYVEAVPLFAVGGHWPAEVLEQLGSADAAKAAADAPAATIVQCLRNALAHGGVTYLDRNGHQSEDATNMLGFASYPSVRRKNELRLLRISVDDFQRFLSAWSAWLAASGVQAELDAHGPGWFEEDQAA